MQNRTDPTLVRQHERVQCAITALLSVAPEHAQQVRLARSVGDGHGAVRVTITDCSSGGLGISSPVFFPKSCLLRVRIPRDGAPLDATLRVQRVRMIGREPTFYLGASFVDREDVKTAEALLAAARESHSRQSDTAGRPAGA